MSNRISRLAIIPARGGSKGIPGKNLQLVGQDTLVGRAIQSAKVAGIFDDICVSTDSKEIAKHAEDSGVEVPFIRPKEISTDTSVGIEVILHALDFYRNQGTIFDTVTLLQPTSPFRTHKDVAEANRLFDNSQSQSLISVLEVSQFHPSTIYKSMDSSSMEIHRQLEPMYESFSTGSGTLRQNFPNLYWRNGAIYIFRADNLVKNSPLLRPPILGFTMNWIKSINIDTVRDLELARSLVALATSEE